LVDEVTAMYESNPNNKGIKSIAEIPAEKNNYLKIFIRLIMTNWRTQPLQKKLHYGKL
tara:strand:- start:144 stop:317 length:174 start_codon:yes stop_codon:yes gene_type:complete